MPLRFRHGYAAGIHRGLPTGDIDRPKEFPAYAGAHRNPAQICQVRAGGLLLRGVHTLVHCRYTFPSRSPDPTPSDSADVSRLCQGCLPPSPMSLGSGCPQLQPVRCDGPAAVSFHHSTVRKRLVALDIPTPNHVRSCGHQPGFRGDQLSVPGRHPPAALARVKGCSRSSDTNKWPIDRKVETHYGCCP